MKSPFCLQATVREASRKTVLNCLAIFPALLAFWCFVMIYLCTFGIFGMQQEAMDQGSGYAAVSATYADDIMFWLSYNMLQYGPRTDALSANVSRLRIA
jgi:hypothetical protein